MCGHRGAIEVAENNFGSQQSTLYAASLSLVGLEHALAGHLEAAWQRFLESQRIALSRADLPVMAATTLLLGEVCRARGELQEASRYYHQALAHFAARSLPPARTILLQALRLAQPENYQRLFLDEGQPLHTVLKSTLKEIQEPELALYVRRLLEAFEREQGPAASSTASDSSALLEPLTSQEQRVLRLLAEGASNQQIAAQLVIELSTVKKHMTNLLAKLGATNRTQAVVRAREYDLL